MSTKVEQFIADLDGGVFEEKLSAILSDVAASVIDHGKKGTVSITLDMWPASTREKAQSFTLKASCARASGRTSKAKISTPLRLLLGLVVSFRCLMVNHKGNNPVIPDSTRGSKAEVMPRPNREQAKGRAHRLSTMSRQWTSMTTSLLIKTVTWPVIKDSRVIVACFTREARVNLGD